MRGRETAVRTRIEKERREVKVVRNVAKNMIIENDIVPQISVGPAAVQQVIIAREEPVIDRR